jgi:hypothetical protein
MLRQARRYRRRSGRSCRRKETPRNHEGRHPVGRREQQAACSGQKASDAEAKRRGGAEVTGRHASAPLRLCCPLDLASFQIT